MPDITNHPQFDAVAMMIEDRICEIADQLGCKTELIGNAWFCSQIADHSGKLAGILLHAYDATHSTPRATP